MGLFGRKAPPQPAAPPSAPRATDDPLVPLLRMKVDQAVFADNTLTLTFKGAGGEAHLEAYGKVVVRSGGKEHPSGAQGFDALLRLAAGRTVTGAVMRVGREIVFELEGGTAVAISLVKADYPGSDAAYLKGPGKSNVNFHEGGFARLAL